jgi:CRISPR/Cas system type I-B associated protein Csh2 (Cas7 group RAMP superfamily)
MLTYNSIWFLLVNYAELLYMYKQYRGLRKVQVNEMNIKDEMIVTTLSWILFSVFYFGVVFLFDKKDHSIGFAGIILRDFFTFCG